jgi:hypothetical protein
MMLLRELADGSAIARPQFVRTGLGGDEDELFNFPARVVRVMDGDLENIAVKFKVRIILGDLQFIRNGVPHINQINLFLEAVPYRMLRGKTRLEIILHRQLPFPANVLSRLGLRADIRAGPPMLPVFECGKLDDLLLNTRAHFLAAAVTAVTAVAAVAAAAAAVVVVVVIALVVVIVVVVVILMRA